MTRELILGGPGAGKTTYLLDIVEQELARGVAPREIAFVAFTKAAATEAAHRAAEKFGIAPEDLEWFRTIHSLAYQQLSLSRDEVIDRRDWKAFGDLIGESMSGSYDTDSPIPVGNAGDVMLRVVDYANTAMITLDEAWHQLSEPIDWHTLKRFEATYRMYKMDVGKIDFTDMLLSYIQEGNPLNVKVAVIDEAQDLTAAQWAVVNKAFANAEHVYICGDDDQAIYRWAGADVDHFLGLTATPTVLPVSHRLPRSVYALAQKVAGRISRRYTKDYQPTDKTGSVCWHLNMEGVDLDQEGTWLLLARNKYLLQGVEQLVRDTGYNYRTRKGNAIDRKDLEVMSLWSQVKSGKRDVLTAQEVRTLHKALDLPVPALREADDYLPAHFFKEFLKFEWYDALNGISRSRRDFYLACLRRKEKIWDEPRIRIETIHGVKGAEADNVMILTDISSRTHRGYYVNADAEHRVFYVGVTRSRRSLHIVQPQTSLYYPL